MFPTPKSAWHNSHVRCPCCMQLFTMRLCKDHINRALTILRDRKKKMSKIFDRRIHFGLWLLTEKFFSKQCHGWACALVCTRFGELFEPSAILNFALGMIQGKFTQKYALEQPLFCTFWFSFCLVWKILHCSCVFFASMDSEVGEDSIVSFELLWSWQIWSWLVSCLLLM